MQELVLPKLDSSDQVLTDLSDMVKKMAIEPPVAYTTLSIKHCKDIRADEVVLPVCSSEKRLISCPIVKNQDNTNVVTENLLKTEIKSAAEENLMKTKIDSSAEENLLKPEIDGAAEENLMKTKIKSKISEGDGNNIVLKNMVATLGSACSLVNKGDLLKVMVTIVKDSLSFSALAFLGDYQYLIRDGIPELDAAPIEEDFKPMRGSLVAAQSLLDQAWYRSCVVNIKENCSEYDVIHIDLGCEDTVTSVKPLPKASLHSNALGVGVHAKIDLSVADEKIISVLTDIIKPDAMIDLRVVAVDINGLTANVVHDDSESGQYVISAWYNIKEVQDALSCDSKSSMAIENANEIVSTIPDVVETSIETPQQSTLEDVGSFPEEINIPKLSPKLTVLKSVPIVHPNFCYSDLKNFELELKRVSL